MTTEITVDNLDMIVGYDYQPEERMVWYYPDGSGYPGHPEECNIYSILFRGIELIEQFTSEEITKMEEEILENLNTY